MKFEREVVNRTGRQGSCEEFVGGKKELEVVVGGIEKVVERVREVGRESS